ncbi:MAG TPA: SDR family NAD(P)-dependent oxidoreductase [Acidimicrobiales bacterium]|nr:SDR family NAD(P)-dependent oxidoreductase [Acidimicrobiales bacterium]
MTAPRGVSDGVEGGRIALVTGASSGIGAATARALAAAGTTVALVARRADRLDQVLADCRRAGAPASDRWVADLSNPEGAAALAEAIWDCYGRLDVVVNNAGAPMRRAVTRLTLAEVERAVQINYLSPVAVTLAVLPRMLARGTGTVVNVSSLGGRMGVMTESAYSGSKFALAGWTEAAAAELAGTGVRLKLVLPGAIDTEIWDQPDNDPPVYTGPLVPAEEVADGIVAAIDADQFEHYLPDMKAVVQMKTDDIDGFMAGMRAMADHQVDEAAVAEATRGHLSDVPRTALPGQGPEGRR